MPDWVLKAIEVRTGMDPRQGRRLRADICPHCNARVLSGWDDDVMALHVRIQPDPIDQTGELLAVIQTRPTYDLISADPGLKLRPRSSSHMKRPRAHPVVTTHDCTRPIPTDPTPPGSTRPARLPAGAPAPF